MLRRRWRGLLKKVAAETEFNIMHLKAVTKIPVQNRQVSTKPDSSRIQVPSLCPVVSHTALQHHRVHETRPHVLVLPVFGVWAVVDALAIGLGVLDIHAGRGV